MGAFRTILRLETRREPVYVKSGPDGPTQREPQARHPELFQRVDAFMANRNGELIHQLDRRPFPTILGPDQDELGDVRTWERWDMHMEL